MILFCQVCHKPLEKPRTHGPRAVCLKCQRIPIKGRAKLLNK